MDAPLSSPDDRNLSRKVTYLGAKKRKRVISTSVHDSDSDTSSSQSIKSSKSIKSPAKTPVMTTPSPTKAASTPNTSSRRGPKKVDVNLPGPSPIKRVRHDSDESVKSSKPTKGRARAASTITAASLKEITQQVADTSSGTKKTESKKPQSADNSKSDSITVRPSKPKSRAKSIAAEEDFDDNASVADSTISVTKTRRNEVERIEYYRNQPECGILEPHAAQCTRCDKMVKLGKRQTYAVRPWEIHRARCDQKPAQATQPTPAPVPAEQSPSSDIVDTPAAIVPSSSQPTSTPAPARRPSEADRKSFLEAEKQIKQLETNRALCAKCDQWIALSEATSYTSGNWMKHKLKCFDAVPSNRVASAKRKLLLVNDRQVKAFTASTVDCNNCGIRIVLEGDGDYNLTAWDAHKVLCTKSIPIPRSDTVNSIAFPSRSSRPPASSGSVGTTDTIVAESGASTLSQGVKRSRDEAEANPEDAQPAVRQRTATYLPPQIEPPNTLLGWFMLPFSSFARGFKESLRDRS